MSLGEPDELSADAMEAPPKRACWRCGKSVDAGLPKCPYCAAAVASDSPRVQSAAITSVPGNSLFPILVVYGILLALSVVLALAVRVALDRPAGAGPAPKDELTATLVMEGIDAVVVLGALAYIRPRGVLPRKSISDKALAWLAFLPVFAGLLAMNFAYHWFLRSIAGVDPVESNVFKDPDLLPGWILAICIQPAIIEELYFRYLALGGLRTVVGMHAAVILSAVMFGMLHLFVPLSIPMLIVLGIGLGYARVYSGGLALPIVLHFLHNAAVMMLQR